jgi:chloramphenicol-sensitive protein RarD
MASSPSPDRAGLSAGLAAFVSWGLFPLLFDAMAGLGASAWEIVGWRTLWSVPFVAALVAAGGRGGETAAIFKSLRRLTPLLASAALIAVNWTVYVWAVSSGRTLAASLGYYINPLLTLAFGAVFFGERVSRLSWIGVALAAIGVGVQALALGAVPWIPLVLAFSFASYGAVRKHADVDAATGLLVECLVLAPPALILVAALGFSGAGHFGRAPTLTALLILAGPLTVAPLTAFAFAARRLPLGLIGFLQFISPTLQFACGVYLGERLAPSNLLAFGFIWAGVATFVLGRRARCLSAASAVQTGAGRV